MENQHRKISGDRELSAEEIALMNEIKALGPQIESVLNKIKLHHSAQSYLACSGGDEDMASQSEAERLRAANPSRWLAIGTTHLQEGLMALTRSVAQPTFF